MQIVYMDFHIQIVKTLSFINYGFKSSVENKIQW